MPGQYPIYGYNASRNPWRPRDFSGVGCGPNINENGPAECAPRTDEPPWTTPACRGRCSLHSPSPIFGVDPFSLSAFAKAPAGQFSFCSRKKIGAGGRNRTDIASLEGWSFTTKLHPLLFPRHERLFAASVKSGFELQKSGVPPTPRHGGQESPQSRLFLPSVKSGFQTCNSVKGHREELSSLSTSRPCRPRCRGILRVCCEPPAPHSG